MQVDLQIAQHQALVGRWEELAWDRSCLPRGHEHSLRDTANSVKQIQAVFYLIHDILQHSKASHISLVNSHVCFL